MITLATCLTVGTLIFKAVEARQANVRPSDIVAMLVEAGAPPDQAPGLVAWAYRDFARISTAGRREAAETARNEFEAECINRIDGPVK